MGLEKNRVVDPVLTNIARGYRNATLIGTTLLPVVRVEKEGGKVPSWGKEAFKIYTTLRAIRANSNRIRPEQRGMIPYVMDEHDLEYPVDYREAQEDIFNLRDHGRRVAQDGVLLDQEKAIADLLTNPLSYPVGCSEQLIGNDQFSAYETSKPTQVVADAKEACRQKIAVDPNTLYMGSSVFNTLKFHPELLGLVKYSMKGIVTAELMKEIFGAENILIGKAVFADDAGNFGDVWGDVLGWAYVPSANGGEHNQYSPSFGYTLAKRGSAIVDSYTENGGKLEIIRYTDIYESKILGAEAGYLVYDCIAPDAPLIP